MSLLTPIQVGPFTFPNRVVMVPLTRTRAGPTRLANDYMREYYEMRASAGLIITECTAISEIGYGWNGAPAMYTKEHSEAWKPITKAVHDKGGRIFMQIWHGGRQSHSSLHHGEQNVSASAIVIPGDGHVRDINGELSPYQTPRALETEEVIQTILDFGKSAALAKEAGFDGVELHGANGYLIDCFLQSSTNHRTDLYGGSKENRFNFLKEIIEEVGKVYSYDRIGVRLSPNGVFAGMGSSDNHDSFCYYVRCLNDYKLAYLHAMDGLGYGFHGKDKAMTLFDFRKNYDGIIISNVGHTQESSEGTLRTGTADLIAFGRLYITNPDLVERFKNNWPLTPFAPRDHWYGKFKEVKDGVEGYTTYRPYNLDN